MMKKSLLFFFLSITCLSFSFAQTKTISGTVTDKETGESLIGVSVSIKGTTQGTQTDLNGKFTFNKLPNTGSLTLQAKYIGYKNY